MACTSKKIKILFLIGGMGGGGAEKVLLEILRKLSRERFALTLGLVAKSGVHLSAVPQDIPIYYAYKGNEAFKFWPKAAQWLYKLYRKPLSALLKKFPALFRKYFIPEQYDLEVAFVQDLSGVFAAEVAQSAVKVVWIHNNVKKITSIDVPSLKRNLELADKVVTVSNAIAADLNTLGIPSNKLKTLYNPFDIEGIRARAQEQSLAFPKPTFIGMGRLCPQKNFKNLLHAFREVCSRGLDWDLVILGEGEEQPTLKALACHLGISERVRFPGFQKNPYAWLKAAEIFILSSSWEGFSNVLVESLALEKAIVATDCDFGPREILNGGEYGLLCPIENSQALAACMYDMASNAPLRAKFKAQALSRARSFSSAAIIPQIESFFKAHLE